MKIGCSMTNHQFLSWTRSLKLFLEHFWIQEQTAPLKTRKNNWSVTFKTGNIIPSLLKIFLEILSCSRILQKKSLEHFSNVLSKLKYILSMILSNSSSVAINKFFNQILLTSMRISPRYSTHSDKSTFMPRNTKFWLLIWDSHLWCFFLALKWRVS